MRYVDGFLIPVPKKKVAEYRRMASLGGKIWMKHGALEYLECVADDMNTEMSGIKFPTTVRCKPTETLIFSFIIFKSRAHRNQVNAKVMKDPAMSPDDWKDKPMPFDMKRMAYGGFKALVDRK